MSLELASKAASISSRSSMAAEEEFSLAEGEQDELTLRQPGRGARIESFRRRRSHPSALLALVFTTWIRDLYYKETMRPHRHKGLIEGRLPLDGLTFASHLAFLAHCIPLALLSA